MRSTICGERPLLRASGALVWALALGLPCAGAGLTGCGQAEDVVVVEEESIQGEIEVAGGCESSNECVDVGAVCPFGCQIPVNVSEAARIEDMLNRWQDDPPRPEDACAYSCPRSQPIECVDGQCTVVEEN